MIHIVDYSSGNQTSVKRALASLGKNSKITSDPEELISAERIIFPGVGHAHSALANLRENGLDQSLITAFKNGTPILGICVGCQILMSSSEETDQPCLDLIEGTCLKFHPEKGKIKVPHMGWNELYINYPHPILQHLEAGDQVYFLHSYYPCPANSKYILATSFHGINFPAVIGIQNLVATQFHIEKSGPVGLRVLSNFLDWDGTVC